MKSFHHIAQMGVHVVAGLTLVTGLALPGLSVAADDAGLALAKKKACMGCHMVERKMIGPAFKDVAAKYAGQADGAAVMTTSIRQGSKGKWGAIPMAPNTTVTEGDAAVLVPWILSLK